MSPAIPLPSTRKSQVLTEVVGSSRGWYCNDGMAGSRLYGEAWLRIHLAPTLLATLLKCDCLIPHELRLVLDMGTLTYVYARES